MRTLHITTDRDRRGAQVHAMDLSEGLRDRGTDTDVVALAPGQHDDLLPIDALGPSRLSRLTLRQLRRRASSADIVIAHGSTTLAACAVAVPQRVPFVYRQISDPRFWAATPGRRVRTAMLLRRPDHVVALSASAAADFATHYRLPMRKITTIPNAVPAGSWPAIENGERDRARRALGMPSDAVIAVALGALVPEKGVDLAIKAVARCPSAVLLVVGAGPERPALERLASDLAPDRIRFLGPRRDPRAVLAASDVLVLASRGGDSMPAVLIEAGLCGLPVITTRTGAIADVVVDGATGSVVPVGDEEALVAAAQVLVEDEDRRHRFGQAARARCVAHFTIDAVVPAWLRLFAILRS